MALPSASDFIGYSDSYAVPSGSSDVIFSGSVDLILSTGITQQVFYTLSTALKCTFTWRRINYIPYHLMRTLAASVLETK